MKQSWLLAAFCLICSISASTTVSAASGETIDLGPAQISMYLASIGDYTVEKESSSSADHHEKGVDFIYPIYPATITADETSGQVLIEVHEMSASMPLDTAISWRDTATGLKHCIEQSELVPRRAAIQTEPYQIDGHEGILAKVDEGGSDPMYIAAYSPDQKDGSGTIVCIVGSNLPWQTTKTIFDSIEARVV
jgi:hypothetical protein